MIARRDKDLVLYLADRSTNDPHFGAVKLNKLLFFIDSIAMTRWGKAVSTLSYKKDLLGPVPVAMRDLVKELTETGEAIVVEREVFSNTDYEEEAEPFIRKPLITLKRSHSAMDQFSGREVALITEVLDSYRSSSGPNVSDLSHDMTGWRLAKFDEEIPLETAFIVPAPPNKPQLDFIAAKGSMMAARCAA